MNNNNINLDTDLQIKRVLELLNIEYKNNAITSDYQINEKENYVKDFSRTINKGKALYPIRLYAHYENKTYIQAKNELLSIFYGINNNSNEYTNNKVIKKIPAPAPAVKETKNSKYSLEEKEKCISTLFTISSLTSQHKKKFIDKRGFEPTEYYKSYSRFTINELEKRFPKNLIKECGLYDKRLNDRILIFHPDINKNIVTYRAYSFTHNIKKFSPYTSCGLKTIPYRVDLLNDKTKAIVITEGEEKADRVNILELKEKAFISIGSINYDVLFTNFVIENKELFINRDIIILFDRKKETKFSEETQAYKIAKKLIQLGFNCFICFMPDIPNCDESDLSLIHI